MVVLRKGKSESDDEFDADDEVSLDSEPETDAEDEETEEEEESEEESEDEDEEETEEDAEEEDVEDSEEESEEAEAEVEPKAEATEAVDPKVAAKLAARERAQRVKLTKKRAESWATRYSEAVQAVHDKFFKKGLDTVGCRGCGSRYNFEAFAANVERFMADLPGTGIKVPACPVCSQLFVSNLAHAKLSKLLVRRDRAAVEYQEALKAAEA